MNRAIIFANGELNVSSALRSEIRSDDLVIAADGGSLHCRTLGITPHIVIGDFDSVPPEELTALQAGGSQLIRYPARKDKTDLELAFDYARQQGCQQIILIGALGARWDMSIANILLTAHPAYKEIEVRLVDNYQELLLLQSAGKLTLHGQPGDTLSLIPLNSRAEGITTQGLEYALADEDLEFASSRGVSNVFTEETATITLRQGLLICVVIRNGGKSEN
jgi:thiamine pyrophosphokinase